MEEEDDNEEEALVSLSSEEELDESLSDDKSLEDPSESLLLSLLESFTLQTRGETVQSHDANTSSVVGNLTLLANDFCVDMWELFSPTG